MKTFWPLAEEPIVIAANEAHLYAVSVDAARSRWNELLAILAADERQRAGQFQLEGPEQRFVAGRAALRLVLGRYLQVPPTDVQLAADRHGKPRLAGAQRDAPYRFNVAHSADLALIVVACGCEVGVDLERLRAVPRAAHIASRYFHAAEREAILAAPPSARHEAFLQCWTAKEAVLKAIGVGVTGSLNAFAVSASARMGAHVDVPAQAHLPATRLWVQRFEPNREYVSAVAFANCRRDVRLFNFPL